MPPSKPSQASTSKLKAFAAPLLATALTTISTAASAQELSLNGFGDLNYGYLFGRPASQGARRTFDAFGEDIHPKNSHSGFGLVGTDFVVTAELPADLVYLGEINFQVERGQKSELEVDVERMFLEKRFTEKLNVQAGLFFTPIGYFNRTLYSRAFLMNSVQVPDLFEEELGLVPTHTIGAQVHGQFSLGKEHRLGYALSLGNGRGANPVENVYARDDDGWHSGTAMLEWSAPWTSELRVGVSGWTDKIRSHRLTQLGEVRDTTDPTTESIELRELGVSAHVVVKSRWINAIAEAVYQRHDDVLGNLPKAEDHTHLLGGFFELSANLGPEGAIKPYLRYDRVLLPDQGGPYFGLRGEGTQLTRVYVADVNLGMAGVAWDPAASWRLKLEYSTALAGPRERHSVVAQSAFAF
jgi:hypothetical protein